MCQQVKVCSFLNLKEKIVLTLHNFQLVKKFCLKLKLQIYPQGNLVHSLIDCQQKKENGQKMREIKLFDKKTICQELKVGKDELMTMKNNLGLLFF